MKGKDEYKGEDGKFNHQIYRDANKDKIKERMTGYREKNKEIISQKNAKYHETNKELINAKRRLKYLQKKVGSSGGSDDDNDCHSV